MSNSWAWTSLGAQWIRICLPAQGLIPVPGRFHMLWSNQTPEAQLLSPRAETTEACVPGARAPQQEKHRKENALQLESCPHSPQLEETCARGKDPVQPKINHYVGAKVIMAFTLLKFAIWYWSTFLTKCGYVIHHFNMHLSLCVFWLMTYYLLCVLYLF